jgi:hypothetical protein
MVTRNQPWRRLAALRAARRRAADAVALEVSVPRDPLPPLVSPDDDREFLHSRPAQATLEVKAVC